MRRVIFGMINNQSRPVGGIKVIFQAAGGLRRAGIEACIFSEKEMPNWLAGNPLAADADILDASKMQSIFSTDLYVATDSFNKGRGDTILGRGNRAIIFFQNHSVLHTNKGINWADFRNTPSIAVSHFTAAQLTKVGFKDVTVISPGIDRELFKPAARKTHQICFMPRKWPEMTAVLQQRFGQQAKLREIDGQTEAEVAEILSTSTIFVSLGRNEGLGLPPLEAMSAGCLVCGFAGQGTLDYARPENGFWTREGDIEGCLEAIDKALKTVTEDQETYQKKLTAGLQTAANYSLEGFIENITGYMQSRL